MRTAVRFLVLLIAVHAGLHAAPQGGAPPPRSALLIGWDGAGRSAVRACLERGELPALGSVVSRGAMVAIDIQGTTDTKAGWCQILTGYAPEITGVYGNLRYGPIPRGYTLFERLKACFGKDFVSAAVIGKKAHVGNDPPQVIELVPGSPLADSLSSLHPPRTPEERQQRRRLLQGGRIVAEKGARFLQIPGKPYFYTSQGMDLFENGLSTNERVGKRALEVLEELKDRRFFLFVHFAEVDHAGHRFGENSPEYRAAIVSSDEWTGMLLGKLKDLKLEGSTCVYVTADHGFDAGGKRHRDAPEVFLGTNDPAVRHAGTRADIAPTIYVRLGLDARALRPALSGRSLSDPEAR